MKPPTLLQVKSQRKPDRIPAGWFTRQQLENEWNLSRDYAGSLIKQAIIEGKAEMKKFLIPTPTRGLYPTQHYKFRL
jgi:hypothetical protein